MDDARLNAGCGGRGRLRTVRRRPRTRRRLSQTVQGRSQAVRRRLRAMRGRAQLQLGPTLHADHLRFPLFVELPVVDWEVSPTLASEPKRALNGEHFIPLW